MAKLHADKVQYLACLRDMASGIGAGPNRLPSMANHIPFSYLQIGQC